MPPRLEPASGQRPRLGTPSACSAHGEVTGWSSLPRRPQRLAHQERKAAPRGEARPPAPPSETLGKDNSAEQSEPVVPSSSRLGAVQSRLADLEQVVETADSPAMASLSADLATFHRSLLSEVATGAVGNKAGGAKPDSISAKPCEAAVVGDTAPADVVRAARAQPAPVTVQPRADVGTPFSAMMASRDMHSESDLLKEAMNLLVDDSW